MLNITLTKKDFRFPFSNPRSCPLAQALRRNGFTHPLVGTLGADVKVDGINTSVWVNGVYLNGRRIDIDGLFGPNEYDRIQAAFERDPHSVAFVSFSHLN